MKINYKNTALKFLEEPNKVPIHTPDGYSTPLTKEQDYKLLYGLIDDFSQEGFADFFNKKIQYITQPFYEAYRKGASKLKEVILKDEVDDSGTFILSWTHHTQTIFYRIKSSGDGDINGMEVFILMLTKTTIHDSYAVDLVIYFKKDSKEIMDLVWKGFAKEGRDMAWWIAEIMYLKAFMKYAEVESKIINAKKKDYHVGTKYVNETNNNIEVLDSTYFTTISRTEGFGVRGHFRFQPCGIGNLERKLIWISEFEKHGYTRKAKIFNQ